ncbi:MAG: aminopeptidase P N-terminal domain-containing protein [Armatimonadetes bacterium]|nr:aminopeptidase P N-terminal domain-containing protein [Armatimonadota bacterium]
MSSAYAQRRARLLDRIGAGVVVVECGREPRNPSGHDTAYHPRPSFHYLTGFSERDGVLVLSRSSEGETKSTLFVLPRDAKAEMWTGRRVGAEAARELVGVDEAHDLTELDEKLPGLLRGHADLYLEVFEETALRAKLLGWCNRRVGAKTPADIVPQTLHNLTWTLAQMRLYKDDTEIEAIRAAVAVTEPAYRRVMAECRPGLTEGDLQAVLDGGFLRDGGQGPAYGTIVASGDNANVLHYVNNDQPLRDGDLVLIDAAAQARHYACDVTRTFPIGGRFTPIQRDVYQIVLESMHAGFALARPGGSMDAIHEATMARLTDGLLALGALSGSRDELLEKKAAGPFCPYSICHPIGLNVHDPSPRLDDAGHELLLQPGAVFTVEPGLYFPADNAELPAHLRGLGLRIEDDLLITADGYENLTAGIAKQPDEVEAWCGG